MKGILFKPDMIQAIVDLRKTATRRLDGLKEINREPERWHLYPAQICGKPLVTFSCGHDFGASAQRLHFARPRYQVGETVYIKETHYRYGRWAKNGLTKTGKQRWRFKAFTDTIYYADNPPSGVKPNSYRQEAWYKRSPLFMPEWAARHFIKILAVRAERLQEISLKDIKAEGTIQKMPLGYTYWAGGYQAVTGIRAEFAHLWDSINPKYPWESNPWVFSYEFVKET